MASLEEPQAAEAKLGGSDGSRDPPAMKHDLCCGGLGRCLAIVLKRSAAIRILLPAIFILSVVKEILTYFCGTISATFYPILAHQQEPEFFIQLKQASLIVLAMAVVITAQKYTVKVTQICWREAFTMEIHDRYFSNGNFYKVNCMDPGVSNPDQRITQDVNELCVSLCETFPVILLSPLVISYYMYQSVIITGSILSPVIVLTFALLCSILSKVFMSPIVWRVVEQQRREGIFRNQHLGVITNAESIAFINRADRTEHVHSDKLLGQLLKAQHSVALSNVALDMTLNSTDYFYAILAFMICAIPVFSGVYKDVPAGDLSGIISKNAFVTMYLASCFSNLLRVFKNLVTVDAMVVRVNELLDSIPKEQHEPDFIQCSTSDPPKFKLENLTFGPPNGDCVLVSNLSMELACGSNLLITGPSNSGKTSFFRLLRGLWEPTLGQIHQTGDINGVVFVPPRTYLGSSCKTLRHTVAYPDIDQASAADDDKEIYRCLQLLRLRHLLTADLDLDINLPDSFLDGLSAGEQQRLVLCRILLSRPRMAFVDEAFNSLDREIVARFFTECRRLNITIVSISHQTDLLEPFHDRLLRLTGDGLWQLTAFEAHASATAVDGAPESRALLYAVT